MESMLRLKINGWELPIEESADASSRSWSEHDVPQFGYGV
jgi:hypothetical protein